MKKPTHHGLPLSLPGTECFIKPVHIPSKCSTLIASDRYTTMTWFTCNAVHPSIRACTCCGTAEHDGFHCTVSHNPLPNTQRNQGVVQASIEEHDVTTLFGSMGAGQPGQAQQVPVIGDQQNKASRRLKGF